MNARVVLCFIHTDWLESIDELRTYRLDPRPAQQAAYRRLAVAILGLDVRHLATELRTVRAEIARAA